MAAAGKLLGNVSHVAEKANPILEGANSVKELSEKSGGESQNAAPPGSTPDNAIQDLVKGLLSKLSEATGS